MGTPGPESAPLVDVTVEENVTTAAWDAKAVTDKTKQRTEA